MKKNINRLLGLLLIGLLPLNLAAQFNKFEEANSEQKFQEKRNYPVHVSHILNSPENMARFEPLIKELPASYKVVADTVGTIKIFKVYNIDTGNFDQVEFKLMRKGAVSQLWFATGEISNGHLTEDVADTMIVYLETKTNNNSYDPSKGVIALGNEVLGNPPDYDGDGLSDVFVCDIQDGWDPEVGGGYVAGFFYSIDQQNHVNSNMRDVIYIDSYPGIYDGAEADPLGPLSTLSHEYQHLIHYNYGNLNTFQNESQSCFASLLTGYIPHGSYYQYLDNTNIALFQWNSNKVFPEYGRAAVFSAYLWDQWGFENAGNLTQSPSSGKTGIEYALTQSGSDWSFADLLVNWGVANYVNDTTLTGNPHYGYKHKMLKSWLASPTVVVDDPNLSGEVVSVFRSGISYMTFKGVSDLSATVTYSGDYGRMKVITMRDGEITVSDLANGVAYNSPAGVVYSEIVIMLVNTEPSSEGLVDLTKMDFTINSSGTVSLATESTYSPTYLYYWAIPYYSSSSAAYRYGFSNQYNVNPGGYLTKLRLYTTYGWNGQDSVKVWGTGQMKMAIYTDNAGSPGTEVHADTVDFSEIHAYWNDFNVSHWNYPIEKDVPFHVVYEFIVPTLDPDVNSVPLRLDDGYGVQNVTNIVTSRDPFETSPMFTEAPGRQYNVWNEIQFLIDPAVAIEDENVFTPLEFRLQQNYPNPLNPTTTIKYQIPSASDVNLTIYNSVGQKVRTLYSGQRNAGTYEVQWDGKNEMGNEVSSGIYFYQLKAGSRQQVNKMILMR